MKPNTMPRPISVKAVGKPNMITTTIRPSIVSPRPASLTFGSLRAYALVRRFIDLMGVFDCTLARFLVNQRAAGELLFNDIDLLRVLKALRPLAGSQADRAAPDLGDTLNEHQDASDRNDGLE